jgi:hypothetical protein
MRMSTILVRMFFPFLVVRSLQRPLGVAHPLGVREQVKPQEQGACQCAKEACLEAPADPCRRRSPRMSGRRNRCADAGAAANAAARGGGLDGYRC